MGKHTATWSWLLNNGFHGSALSAAGNLLMWLIVQALFWHKCQTDFNVVQAVFKLISLLFQYLELYNHRHITVLNDTVTSGGCSITYTKAFICSPTVAFRGFTVENQANCELNRSNSFNKILLYLESQDNTRMC